MEKNAIIYNSLKLEDEKMKDWMINFLDKEIGFHKHRQLIEWERDHSNNGEESEKIIAALKAKKEELLKVFAEMENKEVSIDLSVNFTVNSKNKELLDMESMAHS